MMENKRRLILSVVLLVVFWFLISFVGSREVFSVVLSLLFLAGGIWSFIEGIVFMKQRENKDALPLVLMALFLALYALFIGVGSFATSVFDLLEGGIFQGIGYLFYFVGILLFPILGIWAIVNGLRLRRNRQKSTLAISSLVIGTVVALLFLLLLFGLFI